MTTGTTFAPLSARDEGDDASTISMYRDRPALAGWVVWDLLTHDVQQGPDLARIAAELKLPPDTDCVEDMQGFLIDLVTDAAELGYRLASMNLDAFDGNRCTAGDVSRALAAMVHRATVEDPATEEYQRPTGTVAA